MKKDYAIYVVVAIIVLAIAIIVSAIIIANSNKSNQNIQNTESQTPSSDIEESQNNPSTNYDELPADTCKSAGTGCLYNTDCCGAMLCCRNYGANSGYCAVSCA